VIPSITQLEVSNR